MIAMACSSRPSSSRPGILLVPILVALLSLADSTCGFQLLTSHTSSSMLTPLSTPTNSFTRIMHNGRTTRIISNRDRPSILSIRGGAAKAARSSNSRLSMVMVDALAVINTFYQSSPYLAAALTCGTKASAADYVAQETATTTSSTTKRPSFEKMRNLAFIVYGAIYQGMAQEYIYNHLYPTWFGSGTTIAIVLQKVLFDLIIQTTLITLPIAYLCKAAIFRQTPVEAMRRYWEDVTTNGLLAKYFLLWGPVQCITFSVIPEHLRVSFIAFVSFFWLIILSSISARPSLNTTTNSTTSRSSSAAGSGARGGECKPKGTKKEMQVVVAEGVPVDSLNDEDAIICCAREVVIVYVCLRMNE